MFKLDPAPTFPAKVSLSIPGVEKKSVVEFEFQYKNKEQLKDFRSRVDELPEADAILEIVTNWKGFDNDFTQENLKKLLLNFPGSGREIYTAYLEESYGAKAKN